MVSKFQKVVNFLYRRFVQEMGREPATTKEIMDIQDEAVRHFNKTKGVPQGAPKPSFQGFKPTVIEGGKSKEGIGTLLEDSPEAIAKMKADNKAAAERLRKKKEEEELFKDFRPPKDPEFASGGTARVGYADGSYKSEGLFDISREDIRKYKEKKRMDRTSPFAIPDDWLKKFLRRFKKTGTYEQPMASGGTARVGYAGGRLVKGASWVINKLKEQLSQLKKEDFMGKLSNLSSAQKEGFKNELETLIKQLERGGNIPDQMLDTMIADPKFKSVVKTRSIDKDLYDLEDVLLDRQAGKQAEQIVDDVFGKGNPENQQIDMLEKFDVKDRKPNASGGRAGSGLNYLLGEDDQNVRMPSGGLPGLLGE